MLVVLLLSRERVLRHFNFLITRKAYPIFPPAACQLLQNQLHFVHFHGGGVPGAPGQGQARGCAPVVQPIAAGSSYQKVLWAGKPLPSARGSQARQPPLFSALVCKHLGRERWRTMGRGCSLLSPLLFVIAFPGQSTLSVKSCAAGEVYHLLYIVLSHSPFAFLLRFCMSITFGDIIHKLQLLCSSLLVLTISTRV